MLKKSIPSQAEAENLLTWAGTKNPGLWVKHSQNVARAAKLIAQNCGLDCEAAYIMGLLHDIGRYEGVTDLHHVIAGNKFMLSQNYFDIAKIALTHSFPFQDINAYSGEFDCNNEELEYLRSNLAIAQYDDYDKLIQLCDALCTAKGVVLMEIRLIDVAKRRGFNQYTIKKWNAFEQLKNEFSEKCGVPIYQLFFDEICRNIL